MRSQKPGVVPAAWARRILDRPVAYRASEAFTPGLQVICLIFLIGRLCRFVIKYFLERALGTGERISQRWFEYCNRTSSDEVSRLGAHRGAGSSARQFQRVMNRVLNAEGSDT